MTKPRSLAFRLIASSAVVSAVLLLTAAILLNSLFQQALERNFDARLRAVLDGLTANVELAGAGVPVLSQPLADTRFDLPLSGWYWQVIPPGGKQDASLASGSLLEQRLNLPADISARDTDGTATFYLKDANGNTLRVTALSSPEILMNCATRFKPSAGCSISYWLCWAWDCWPPCSCRSNSA
jgi:Two-component sensor kinase N-terminal